tara:strand:- start:187 stop:486 length:300 start_codon:yes stop_codon:yes gene_type:complete
MQPHHLQPLQGKEESILEIMLQHLARDGWIHKDQGQGQDQDQAQEQAELAQQHTIRTSIISIGLPWRIKARLEKVERMMQIHSLIPLMLCNLSLSLKRW